MNAKAEFLKKLNGLVEAAKKQESQITIDEVKEYFAQETLSAEQMDLVFDYLLAQKIAVKGYLKMDSQAERENEFTEEEKAYLKEYLQDLKAFKTMSASEVRELLQQVIEGDELAKTRLIEVYLPQVVEIAKRLHQPEVFLGDLIQEGNLGLVLGVELIQDIDDAHNVIVEQIEQNMQLLLEEQSELSSRDKKMVEKVKTLDEAITNLTEDLGRKVTIDELAIYMGMEIEEIEDILKLTGEEPQESEE